MARTVSTPKTLSLQDRDLLRALYYQQQLPPAIMALGTAHLSRRLQVLEMAGYIRKVSGNLMLSDAGKLALQRLYGGRKPPMIDTNHDAKLDPKSRKKQFVVGSSLASRLAREVSGSE